MDAQTKVLELRAIEKELMELEKRQAKLVRHRRELLEILPGRDRPLKVPSREEMQRMLREACGMATRKK